MARSRLQLAVLCILLCCIIVDFQRSAAVSFTHRSSDGAVMWGYVEVRKGANLFWHYYKSPQPVSSPGKPWPTVFFVMPASSRHGNFNGIGPLLELSQQPHNSTWLNKANLLFVDTPVGTGFSYDENASGNIVRSSPQPFSEAAADILELLRVLTGEIPTLQTSPLFLLHSTYGGAYAGKITTVVAKAIMAGTLKTLTVGRTRLVLKYGGRTTPDNAYWLSHPDYKYTSSYV